MLEIKVEFKGKIEELIDLLVKLKISKFKIWEYEEKYYSILKIGSISRFKSFIQALEENKVEYKILRIDFSKWKI